MSATRCVVISYKDFHVENGEAKYVENGEVKRLMYVENGEVE